MDRVRREKVTCFVRASSRTRSIFRYLPSEEQYGLALFKNFVRSERIVDRVLVALKIVE